MNNGVTGTIDVTGTMIVTRTIGNENNGCSRVSHETKDETDINETTKSETPMSVTTRTIFFSLLYLSRVLLQLVI